jgi:hypothetical protein
LRILSQFRLTEENNEINNEETKEQLEDSDNVVEADQKNEDKKIKKVKPRKLNNKFPREDRNEGIAREGINPRQFSEAWTLCSRCRDQILSFGDSTHFINGYQYCEKCYEYVKSDYLEQTPE